MQFGKTLACGEYLETEGAVPSQNPTFCNRYSNRLFFRGAKMKIVCYTEPTENGLLLQYPSASVKAELLHLWNGAKEKYNGYLTVELKKPYKSRTTGKGSQNNLFWKLVEIICKEIGEEPAIVEADLKQKAIAKGFPYHISKISGQPVPESTTKINTVEMSYLIDTAYEIIAFLGILLEPEVQKEADSSTDYDIF